MIKKKEKLTRFFSFLLYFLFILSPANLSAQIAGEPDHQIKFAELIASFSTVKDRSGGRAGAAQAAEFIKSQLKNLGFSTIGSQTFSLPIRQKGTCRIKVGNNGQPVILDPLLSNAISPGTIPKSGLTAHIVYVGKGELKDYNDKILKGAIVLMDLDSGNNWINALSLGAKALIYIQGPDPDKFLFKDKAEISPVQFPKFVISAQAAKSLLGDFKNINHLKKTQKVTLISDIKWEKTTAENIYCMIPGTDDELKDELIIIESFYDTSAFIPGRSPGADQACSIATLMDLAAYLKANPVKRSVLLIATSGHGNSLQGMREFIWSLKYKSRRLKKMISGYDHTIDESKKHLNLLDDYTGEKKLDADNLKLVQKNILDVIKTKIDDQSNRLMQLRLEEEPDEIRIKKLAARRMALKRLESKNDLTALNDNEIGLVKSLIPPAVKRLKKILKDSKTHKKNLKSSKKLRNLAKSKNIRMIVSLHLSSHGNGIGAFNEGWLYDIKDSINTFSPYVKLNQIIIKSGKKAAGNLNSENILKDSLRPSLHKPWQSYFKDTPALGGEVSRLAGYLGLSFVTTNDARRFWDTPYDVLETVDIKNAARQSRFISNLIKLIASAPDVSGKRTPRNGFATVKGRANFLRHGAVFADAPAPGSVILSFQGPGIFYNIVDQSGEFLIKGVATKKVTLHKVIIEGYKFDQTNGNTIWAIDKKRTTKARYRVKVTKRYMETDLVMFPCSQTSILNLLEPRTFQYMTKLQILDARTDATPIRHWYSRIDTRSSIISSIYLTPGTRLKLALSDTLLTKKLILIHSNKDHSDKNRGNGYRIDEAPTIAPTQYLAAGDMWSLLNPRIDNLENKGINNRKIRELRIKGNQALEDAKLNYKNLKYDKFFNSAGRSLALAGRVYDHVETIQKDVLYGVLFYIMLFAPFSFCLERFLFAFINIYKRIAGFLIILILLIAVIYNVHPAFELAYSPVVVILAFFIIGLSAMVTWIIFHRFENEMTRIQQQGKRQNEGEISFLKAFYASFFMGVNNLRRRKIRTVLTCTTLIILTFTIMSFTSVKNLRRHSKLLYNDQAPYQGLLMKQLNWKGLPSEAFKVIENTTASNMIAAPRAWLETPNRTQSTKIPVRAGNKTFEANGLIGLSPKESEISGFSDHISKGRWFSPKDRYSIIIPERMAKNLHLQNLDSKQAYVRLWSIPFKVIGLFSGDTFDKFKDLDGEPITPAIFPDEIFQMATEAEMEAMESGEDIKAFQSRYKHIPFDQTVIIPYETLISLGGNLKSIALKYKDKLDNDKSTYEMVDRFGLWLFSGEKAGVFLYNASDRLDYSGVPNILIPILISIFIVLNTMIGSVQERKREIGIYTSIGMAPSHVSIIFIAEAISYAVLSVVLGYILAQVMVKVFAGTALLSGITVNYSSLGGVFAMAMVMLVVILSSIYPSRVAASIAIPDVEKSWKLTKAEGDMLNIELPFLIKTSEILSVTGYLYRFLDAHQEISQGIFSVDNLKLSSVHKPSAPSRLSGKDDLKISFTSWLAPFDLGVMQDIRIAFNPSQYYKKYQEIQMSITRKSGERNTWWRVNKRFVNLMRKRLLIWRSLEMDEKKEYIRYISHDIDKETTIA
ncbi:MAG: M28 family peptidase [Deltaproteobacteria bacterium]|nr:M28 family peptidase [Deltaproteobacteria bacterium]